jgi:hypothetical protein
MGKLGGIFRDPAQPGTAIESTRHIQLYEAMRTIVTSICLGLVEIDVSTRDPSPEPIPLVAAIEAMPTKTKEHPTTS